MSLESITITQKGDINMIEYVFTKNDDKMFLNRLFDNTLFNHRVCNDAQLSFVKYKGDRKLIYAVRISRRNPVYVLSSYGDKILGSYDKINVKSLLIYEYHEYISFRGENIKKPVNVFFAVADDGKVYTSLGRNTDWTPIEVCFCPKRVRMYAYQ